MKSRQPNKRLFSLTFTELNGYFFIYYGRLSSAQLDRWQAPTQQPSINHRPVDQMAYRREIKDNGYTSVFTNSWLVRQRNRSWIKGLGKIHQRVNSFIAGSAFFLGPPNRGPMDSEKHLRVYMSARTMTRHATGDVLTKLPAKNTQKSECAFRRSPIRHSNKKLRVYTASNANWLNIW